MAYIDAFDPPMCCSTGVCGLSHLARAGITPVAWVVNQSLTPLDVTDPVLRARRNHEAVHLRELATHGKRTALEAWHDDTLAVDPVGA